MATEPVFPVEYARQIVACRVCSSQDHVPFVEARGFQIVQCRHCGFWYVNPQPTPEELMHFYAGYDEGDQWRQKEQHFNHGVRRAILGFRRWGSILDVGCGSGDFLLCMRAAGFSVFGIEPSKTGSEYARAVHKIEVFTGMVEEYLATGHRRTFGVVTLLNVLEHLTNPAETLRQLRQLVVEDGLLVLVVPDARFHALLGGIRRSLSVRDPYWLERPKSFVCGFKPPHHLSSFSPSTISLLLERCGFTVESLQNAPVIFNPESYRNLAKLLVRWAGQGLYYLTLRRVVCGYSTLVIARRPAG